MRQPEARIIVADVMDGLRQLPDESVHCVVTDPPYNVGAADWDVIPDYLAWCGAWLTEVDRVMVPGAALYMFCSQTWQADLEMLLRRRFAMQNRIVWTYENGQRMATSKFSMAYEPCLFATKSGAPHRFSLDDVRDGVRWDGMRTKRHDNGHITVTTPHPNGRRPVDVWSVPRLTGGREIEHPTAKPEAVMAIPILASTGVRDVVLDPFCGSGTTLIAAMHLWRNSIGIELNSAYAAMAQRRVNTELAQARLAL